jgi:hypothetical protein
MTTTGQQKLNKKDVRVGTLHFLLSFIILCFFSFMTIFLFFKSSEVQKDGIQADLEHYRNIISRNDILKSKLDTVYIKMDKLSKNEVENEIFLRNSLVRDIKECQIVMGQDSIKEFKQYASLVNNLRKIVEFKSEMMTTAHQERIALRDLEDCNRKLSESSKVLSRYIQ